MALPSLGTLLTADPVTVWTDSDPSRNRNICAPEFYRFGSRWYLYYTADDGVDEHHRLYVLESEGDDPAGPYRFKAKPAPPNHADDFAIDASILRLGGRLYLAYSGVNQYQHNGINIAPMSDPYTVSGDAVAIDAAGGCPEVRGAWNSGTGCATQCFWSDDHWSDRAGATATFTGTRIALLSVKDTGNGYAGISVDGGPEQRVDFHGPIRVGEAVQYVSPRLPYGEHTLRVRVTGERNPRSGARPS